MIDPQSLRLLEAVLFAAAVPLGERDLAARLPPGQALQPLLERLQKDYQGRGVTLQQAGGFWAFRTAADLQPTLVAVSVVEKKLSRAALETLAIIAYHQPVTRAEIEEIRGVALSRGTLDALLEAGLVRPRGRRLVPGRPMLWATSEGFLDHFGLSGLDDLPGLEELKAAGLLDARPAMASYANRAAEQPADIDAPLDDLALEQRAVDLLQAEPLDDEA
jgi:segregation and condensation protein B